MSVEFEQKRNDTLNTVAAWSVHIKFPDFEEFTEQNLYFSTTENFDLGDGNVYQGKLLSCKGRHQRDRGNDYAEFVVANPNNSTYQDIYPYEDLIEKAEVTISECYEIEDGYFESEIRFFGYLTDFTLNDKQKTLDFTCLSDMSRGGYPVGGQILTRERCGAEFPYNGSSSPAFELCGWQTSQGGNPLLCTRLLKGIDGCEAHNNEHRFFAVTGLTETPVQIIATETNFVGEQVYFYPSGFDYETRACFSANTLVLMADWTTKFINQIKIGDKVKSFDIFDCDKLIDSEVLNTFSHIVKEIEIAKFDKALLETTKEHLFYVSSQLFAPVKSLDGNLNARTVLGLDCHKQFSRSSLMSCETSNEICSVFNFHTSANNYIVCDQEQNFFYFVHNNKYYPYLS
jgi:hypothetical protein